MFIHKLIHLCGNGSLLTCIILKVQENPSTEGYKSQPQSIISLLSLQRHWLSWSFFLCFLLTLHSVCVQTGVQKGNTAPVLKAATYKSHSHLTETAPLHRACN